MAKEGLIWNYRLRTIPYHCFQMLDNLEIWMQRALLIARRGMGHVAPNPMVGAVLVHPEIGLVAEGWHQVFGGPHAEVHCLTSIQDPVILKESTLFVTLEPCSHFGKTPPCAHLIVEKGIRNVVMATLDPNPVVAGRGMEHLQLAGVSVVSGILASQARFLNRHFFVQHIEKRPFVMLKWAQTADGFIAGLPEMPKQISNDFSRSWVHQLRASFQAILVGRNTLREDDPLLDVRDWPGRSPIRIVIDPDLGLSPSLRIFSSTSAPVWIINRKKEAENGACRWIRWSGDFDDCEAILHVLGSENIQSVFIEGGAFVLHQFLEKGIWDEALVFQSPTTFGMGVKAPLIREGFCQEQFFLGSDSVSWWLSSPY